MQLQPSHPSTTTQPLQNTTSQELTMRTYIGLIQVQDGPGKKNGFGKPSIYVLSMLKLRRLWFEKSTLRF